MGFIIATLIVLVVVAAVLAQDFSVFSWAYWQECRAAATRNLTRRRTGPFSLPAWAGRASTMVLHSPLTEARGVMDTQDTTAKAGATCPNCGRGFNCEGPPECWCLKVERTFDWEGFIMRTGASSCVCPVCLTGKAAEDA